MASLLFLYSREVSPPDSKSEQVRLFIEKMRSKGKSGEGPASSRARAIAFFFDDFPHKTGSRGAGAQGCR
jgi:hypothetical protein